jgi:hypothetical protein
MTWIHIPHITSSTVSPDTADSASDSDSLTRTPTSKRSAISSGTNTVKTSSSSGSAMTRPLSIPLPSGTTSSPSTDDPGVDAWISSLPASRVSRTQTPDSARVPMMTETSGPIPSESLGRWDQDSSFWRTCQVSLWEVMDGHHMAAPWSESWPRSGMTRSGELYPLPMQEPHTFETGGFSLPVRWNTPNTMDALSAKSQQALDHKHETARPGRSNPNNLRDQVAVSAKQRLWLTAVADGDRTTNEDEESWLARHAEGKVATPPLALAARMWATPRVDDSKNNGSASQQERHGPALNVQVKQMLPTPSSGGDSGGPHGIRGGSWAKERLVETFGEEQAVAMSGGSLSPDWVSWLMGLPIGWTSLEPLSQEDYDQWLQMQRDGTWWAQWWGPWWFDCPNIATGIPDRVNRLKCLGNGIVPASLSLFLRGTR